MSEAAFYASDSKSQITGAIRAVEAQTSAEVVVAVRHSSGAYREADYLGGAILALATLCLLLFSPVVFAIRWMPLDVAVAFAVGAFFTANVPRLRRSLMARRRLEASARAAAREVFVDRGVSRTKGRNGILVFVSTFERRAVVLPDVGIDVAALGAGWTKAVGVIEEAARKLDVATLVGGVKELGPVLGAVMPHEADDVNELPDEVDES